VAFAAAGVRGLILSGRDTADLQQTASKAKEHATNPEFENLVIVCDISSEADIIHLIKQAIDKFGKIDYAVNNAGVNYQLPAYRSADALLTYPY
jgi:NAD(P)-dependent dehydrogenase (short-subunit alcohol dehydrogenase family)